MIAWLLSFFCVKQEKTVVANDLQSRSAGQQQPRRYAFMLRLRPGAEEAYETAHRAVWPEMLQLLKDAGISEYSIYRRDDLLILALRADDFETTWSKIDNHPVNLRWQAAMAPYFASIEGLRPGERFPMLEEVFYLR
jgi:L-rhamnose mutarotase